MKTMTSIVPVSDWDVKLVKQMRDGEKLNKIATIESYTV